MEKNLSVENQINALKVQVWNYMYKANHLQQELKALQDEINKCNSKIEVLSKKV
jgi:peptidoglycan hydrolase CwlO-like protein